MFARRLVALALTCIIVLGTVPVPTLLLTVSSLFSSQPLRDDSLAGATLGCAPVDLTTDRSIALNQISLLIDAEAPALPRSSTQTSTAFPDQLQLTLCSRTLRGRPLAGIQPWRALRDVAGSAAGADVALAAWQQPGLQNQPSDVHLMALRL
jgi:hypothetical protein